MKPEEFSDRDAMLARLRALIEERGARIVGIEGFICSGKTHLGCQLATDLPAGLIGGDDCTFKRLYPDRDLGYLEGQPYLANLDLGGLSAKLTEALSNQRVVIVEAICLRDVLARIGRGIDVAVYIKRLSHQSPFWHDGLTLENFETDPTL